MEKKTIVPNIEPCSTKMHKMDRIQVNQYDLLGHYLKTYESISEASKVSKTAQSGISRVCKLMRGSAGGYQWRKAN